MAILLQSKPQVSQGFKSNIKEALKSGADAGDIMEKRRTRRAEDISSDERAIIDKIKKMEEKGKGSVSESLLKTLDEQNVDKSKGKMIQRFVDSDKDIADAVRNTPEIVKLFDENIDDDKRKDIVTEAGINPKVLKKITSKVLKRLSKQQQEKEERDDEEDE